jgi:hypothetical protein
MSRYLNFIKKILNRVVTNPRRAGIESADLILDQDFGSNRGTPLDRQLINEFLEWSVESIPVPVRTLEFGDTIFTQELFPNSENWIFEYVPDQSVKVERDYALSGDLLCGVEMNVPTFEVIVSTQLLAFTEDPFSAARTLVSLLGINGTIVGTEPQFSPISRFDDNRWGDFFRFTQKGINSIFKRTEPVKIETFPIGNWTTTLAIFQGFCREDNLNLPKKKSNNYASNVGFRVTKTGY